MADTNQHRGHLDELFTGSSAERLAMLRDALGEVADTCSEALRDTSTLPPRLVFQAMESGTLPDLLAQQEDASLFGVISAPVWEARILIWAQQRLVYSFIEMVLGADGSEPPHVPDRLSTPIERRVVAVLFEAVARALEARFAPGSPPFVVEALGEEIDPSVFGRRPEKVAIARFQIGGGNLFIAFVPVILNSMRQALAPASAKELKPDLNWTRQIQKQVARSNVVLSAVLEERLDLLGDIAALKVGSVIELDATARTRVRIECNNERLVWCHLGKSNGVYTLRVEDFVDREQEYMSDILAG